MDDGVRGSMPSYSFCFCLILKKHVINQEVYYRVIQLLCPTRIANTFSWSQLKVSKTSWISVLY